MLVVALQDIIDFSFLRRKRDETKIREKLETEIRDLTKRLQIQRNYTSDLETANKTMEEKNKGLIKSLDVNSNHTYKLIVFSTVHMSEEFLVGNFGRDLPT